MDFDSFCRVAVHFLESEDDEALQKELKEAFRLYDKEGKLHVKIKIISLLFKHTIAFHHQANNDLQ